MDVESIPAAPAMPDCWLEQIAHTSAEVGQQHVDLLLDQTGLPASILPMVQRITPAIAWHSLFSGTPEEPLTAQGPLLLRLDLQQWQHKTWLRDIVEHLGNDSRLLLLVTPHPLEDLGQVLTALSRMTVGGQPGLLRFYDPRIFPSFLDDILHPPQREVFLSLASFWSWLDRDGSPQWRQGTCTADAPPPVVPPPLALSDAQYEQFGCISDAQKLTAQPGILAHGLSNEQRFSQLYAYACRASAAGHCGELKHYIEQERAQSAPLANSGIPIRHGVMEGSRTMEAAEHLSAAAWPGSVR